MCCHASCTANRADQVRVWVVGCATGEEAYSLAMLLAERTLDMLDAPKVQIFATDIDEAALAHAREGVYTLNDAADVSPDHLRRFFTKEGDGYRIRREIRELVLFANHNVLKDPPFSHLDLVTCRNVLIYLNHTAQERVLETLHFALDPGGYLFLGTSESPDDASDLYAVVSREHHIFQRRQTSARVYPVPDSVPTVRWEPPRVLPLSPQQEDRLRARISVGDLHQRLLEQYAPPSMVVNETYDIIHLSERAGRYLQVAGGEPSNSDIRVQQPDGLLRWVSITAQVMLEGQPRRATLMYGVAANISERKQAEERQAFLLRLSDALRPLSAPVAVQETTMQVLGAHLGVSRAFYSDVLADEDTITISPGYANGLDPIVGQLKFSAFDLDMMNSYRAGQTVVLDDIQTDAQLSAKAKAAFDSIHVRAAVGVPLVKHGNVRAILSLHQSVPRQWTAAEIALLQEIAERVWAAVERVRAEAALAASEEKYRTLFDSIDEGFGIIEIVWDAAG